MSVADPDVALRPPPVLVHVPGFAVGGDAVTGLGDQAGERTQQHTTGRTGHGAVRVGHRHLAVRTGHVDRERRDFLNARAVTQVSADRHTREQVRGDDLGEGVSEVAVVDQDVGRGVADVDAHTQRPRETDLVRCRTAWVPYELSTPLSSACYQHSARTLAM